MNHQSFLYFQHWILPRMQSSPDSATWLQRRRPTNWPRHLTNNYPVSLGCIGPGIQWYPECMDRLDPTQEAEDKASTLLPAQLIKADIFTTVTKPTITQLLQVALARLGSEHGLQGIKEKNDLASSPAFAHWQQIRAPSY